MAKNASRVRVALTGSVWYNPDLNATIPSDLTTDPTSLGYADLGYTTADGVTFTLSREIEGIDGWQTSEILRQLVTAEPKQAEFVLRQLGRDEWLATNGGTITEQGTGIYRWEPTTGQIPEGILLIDFDDLGKEYRFGFRRAQQTAEVQFSLVRNDAVNLPNTWTAVQPFNADDKAFFMDTNDPAFAPTSAATTPRLDTITPADQAIGESIYLQGVRFTGMTGVTVDGTAVVSPTLVNDGLIEAIIPAGVTTGSPVPVVVTTASGTGTQTYTVSAA